MMNLIFDTDFRSDCDDAGTLAVLHSLADLGECEIAGVIASTTGPHIVGAIDAMNTFYGRPEIPVGLVEGDHPHGDIDPYAPTLADRERFPSTRTNDCAPTSSLLYRQLLFAAPDHSIDIVVTGGQTALLQLLQTRPNHQEDKIPLSGRQLVEQKVRQLTMMAGAFDGSGRREFNITIDIPAAQAVARDWPTPVFYSGFEIGKHINTGSCLTCFDPDTHPLAMAYYLYTHTEGGANHMGDRHSWDQATLHLAVRGTEDQGKPIWELSPPGKVSVDPEGRTSFIEDAEGKHYYVKRTLDTAAITAIIEGLMTRARRE